MKNKLKQNVKILPILLISFFLFTGASQSPSLYVAKINNYQVKNLEQHIIKSNDIKTNQPLLLGEVVVNNNNPKGYYLVINGKRVLIPEDEKYSTLNYELLIKDSQNQFTLNATNANLQEYTAKILIQSDKASIEKNFQIYAKINKEDSNLADIYSINDIDIQVIDNY